MIINSYKLTFLVVLFIGIITSPLKSIANDTIFLEDNFENYNLNLIINDSIAVESKVNKTIYIKNNSGKEEWFFKCDSWGEVILNIVGDTIVKGGWNYPYEKSSFFFTREDRGPTIPLVLLMDSVYEIEVDLNSPVIRGFPSYYNTSIVHSDTIGQLNSFRTIVTGGLVVILLVFAVYNFFLFFLTKDRSFIKYSVTQLLFSLLWLNALGISVYYFEFSLDYIRILDTILPMSYMATYFWFTRGYLNTKESDYKLDIFLKYYQYILFCTVAIFCLFINVNVNNLDLIFNSLLVHLYTPVGVVLLIVSIIRSILKRNKLVFYFSFAMLAFVGTILIMNLELMGANSDNIFVQNSVLFGTVFEAILFSLGLAAKIKISQAEKDAAQDKLFEQLQENQKIKDEFSKGLEKKVEERTVELKQKNNEINLALFEKELLIKEVHHRVKNNLQLMYSFMSLQSNRTQNKLVKEAISESKERIRTLTMIHNNLSFSANTEEINIKSYIPDIATHLSNLSVDKVLKPIVKIDSVFLPVKKAVSLGLILNEIVTNSIKYAEVSKDVKHIYITALKKTDILELVVYDDGNGQQDKILDNNSLGMLIIEDLTKQLKANLTIEQDFKYIINIPIDEKD